MAETSETWIADTQATLGTLVTKPKLTDKLLSKPPFKFLHDVISEVTRQTGFGEGLFAEEQLDAANIKDKDGKLDYLNRIIDCVGICNGETLPVRSTKVVAGLEPEHTNALLQALFRAATQVDRESQVEAVQRVLNGEHQGAAPSKKAREPVQEAKRPDDGARRKQEEAERAALEQRRQETEASAHAQAQAQAAALQAEEEQRLQQEEERKAREEKKRRAEEKKKKMEEKKRQEEEAQRAEEARQQEENDRERRSEEQRAAALAAEEAEAARNKAVSRSSTPQRDRLAAPAQADDTKDHAASGNEGQDEPELAQRRRVERPTTARRRPPKIQSNVVVKEEVAKRDPEGTVATGLIMEGAKDDDDTDDVFVNPGAPQRKAGPTAPVSLDSAGKLVKELYEQQQQQQQKDTRSATPQDDNKENGEGGITFSRLKRNDKATGGFNQVEVDKLRSSIQTLCQSTNPLGKCMDFVHDDIESMNKELDMWRNEYRQASNALDDEIRSTDQTLQPLMDALAAVEEKIQEQQSKINNSKANILKNEITIQNLLHSVVAAR
eukprot:GILK01001830.1.p1 GENE.GILK01001830.1~~GILK01001830.1.p1  ORF type:complete len:562 (-),score=151.20 GILK01001830.1:246-1901(-)